MWGEFCDIANETKEKKAVRINKAEKLILDWFNTECGDCNTCMLNESGLCDRMSDHLNNIGLVDYGQQIVEAKDIEVH